MFVSREEWGARPRRNWTPKRGHKGVAFHWEGGPEPFGTFSHSTCASKVRDIQNFHMNIRNWADIAYSAVVCPHGFVFEGRWVGVRTAGQGTEEGNDYWHAVCYLGNEGDEFTALGKYGMMEAYRQLQEGLIRPHSFFRPTECPGDVIREWIAKGSPLPAITEEILVPIHEVFGTPVAIVLTPTGQGYVILTDRGEVVTFGDAGYFGAVKIKA